MAIKKVEKSNDIIQITHNGEEFTIDLNENCPAELMDGMWNNPNTRFIPVKVVREILRTLNCYCVIKSEQILFDKGMILKFVSTITIGKQVLFGEAQTYLGSSEVSKSLFPKSAIVWSNAMKAALKFKYRFFEADADAEMQSSNKSSKPSKADVVLADMEKPVDKIDADYVNNIVAKMAKADSVIKITALVSDIRKDLADGRITVTTMSAIHELEKEKIDSATKKK